jgi:serpin B
VKGRTTMKRIFCALFFVTLLSIGSARAQVSEEAIPRKQLELGVFLLKGAADKSANVTVSPYSIHSALMLLRLGARGTIATQIDKKLLPAPFSSKLQGVYGELNSKIAISNEDVTSRLANAVWLANGYPFEKDYLASSQRVFASEPRNVDFTASERARQTINEWVSSKTNALISQLIPQGMITKNTTCVLVNALYFKSAWLFPFVKEVTQDSAFWIDGTSQVKVPMMQSSHSLGYFEDQNWQAVYLPYKSHDFLFVVLLPKQKRSVDEVRRALTVDLFTRSFERSQFTKVELSLPRFKVRSSTGLLEQLQAYGLTELEKGDYSSISPRNVGSVGAVIHEAVVSVDEEGTEAAAATAVMTLEGANSLDPAEVKRVNVDRPFAFALVHRASLAPLFVGAVGDPR